jgi:hypothetical protein
MVAPVLDRQRRWLRPDGRFEELQPESGRLECSLRNVIATRKTRKAGHVRCPMLVAFSARVKQQEAHEQSE